MTSGERTSTRNTTLELDILSLLNLGTEALVKYINKP